MMTTNRLYFGDCLDVLREDLPDESVDLIYLDPPFNSKRLYNAYIGGAQWVGFEDTWRWHEAVDDFHEVAADVELGRVCQGLAGRRACRGQDRHEVAVPEFLSSIERGRSHINRLLGR